MSEPLHPSRQGTKEEITSSLSLPTHRSLACFCQRLNTVRCQKARNAWMMPFTGVGLPGPRTGQPSGDEAWIWVKGQTKNN